LFRHWQWAQDKPLPKRCVGEPTLTGGPLKGVTVDHRNLAAQFFENVGWDKNTLAPSRKSLKELGMEEVAKDIGK